MAFGDCQDGVTPLTPQEICDGFAKCGGPGMRLNPTNLTRVIAYLEALLGVDIDTLVTTLCANAAFQECILNLTTASTHTVESVTALPASGPEGTEFCITVTVDSPVLNTALQIPVSLLPMDEQLVHNYILPPFLTIDVGDVSGSACVTTTNDIIDEPALSLVFNLAPTPRLTGFAGGNWPVTVTDNDPTAISAPADTENSGIENAVLDVDYGPFTTSLGGFPTLNATGLPAGVIFTDNGDGTYTLSGNYPDPAPASTVVTITATAPDAPPVEVEHTITSTCAITVVPVIPDIEAEIGEAFTYTSPAIVGSSVLTFALVGALPAAATFTDNGDNTFSIDGPIAGVGDYDIVINATNPCAVVTPIPVTLAITCEVPVAPAIADVEGDAGDPVAFTSDPWTGTLPIVLTEDDLPGGVTFTDNGDGTFTLGGVFPVAGSTAVTVTGTNDCGADGVVFDVVSA